MSHSKSRTFERRPTGHPPALTPTLCDTTPLPFTSLPIDARLLEGVRDLGFAETRPVQSAVIPLALNGDDLIACAETGTGKTCAFVVPTLQRLLTADADPKRPDADPKRVGLPAENVERPFQGRQATPRSRVLILAPTR